MSQTYASLKTRAGKPPASSAPEAAPSIRVGNQSLTALMTGAETPTPQTMGHKVDLPDAIRSKMEASFGADFSAVELYESQAVADAGAKAMTMGAKIGFAPGQLDFTSTGGQTLLGHEFSHIVSQARGEVSGAGFLKNHALESRADHEGSMAAAGESVFTPVSAPLSIASATSAAGPMQAKKDKKDAGAPIPQLASKDKKATDVPKIQLPSKANTPTTAEKSQGNRKSNQFVKRFAAAKNKFYQNTDDFIDNGDTFGELSNWEKTKLIAVHPIAYLNSKTDGAKTKHNERKATSDADKALLQQLRSQRDAPKPVVTPKTAEAPKAVEAPKAAAGPSQTANVVDQIVPPGWVLPSPEAVTTKDQLEEGFTHISNFAETSNGFTEKISAISELNRRFGSAFENPLYEGGSAALSVLGTVTTAVSGTKNIVDTAKDSSLSRGEKGAMITAEGSNITSSTLSTASTIADLAGAAGAVTSGLGAGAAAFGIATGTIQAANGINHFITADKQSKESQTLMDQLDKSTRTGVGAQNDAFMRRMAGTAQLSDTVHKKEAGKEIIDGALDATASGLALTPGWGTVASLGTKAIKGVVDYGMNATINKSQTQMREESINTASDNAYDKVYADALKHLTAGKEDLGAVEYCELENRAKSIALQALFGDGVTSRKEAGMLATQKNIETMKSMAASDSAVQAYNKTLGLNLGADGFHTEGAGTKDKHDKVIKDTEETAAYARYNSDFKKNSTPEEQLQAVRMEQYQKAHPIEYAKARAKATKEKKNAEKQAKAAAKLSLKPLAASSTKPPVTAAPTPQITTPAQPPIAASPKPSATPSLKPIATSQPKRLKPLKI